jgi:HAD superfamily, subfamily IIIB (Acid phosphatase)
MRRFTLILVTAAVAVAPASASASAQSTGQTIPVPDPILTKLGHTPMVELWDGGGGLPYLGSSTSYNAGDWENALRTYHDSGVYVQQLAKVDRVAAQWLRRAQGFKKAHFKKRFFHRSARRALLAMGHGHKHGHGHGGKGNKKRAVVFDIDETALSNYTAINADNFTFGANSQAEAQNEIGTAIEPTLDLFNLAKKKGYATFLITGRRENVRTPTAENLAREGFTGYTQLILRPVGGTGTTVDYKAGERAKIEDQGYRIVANVGDQYSDLAGGHSQVVFKLPNPFYFLP